jgi:alpha-mannosidase
LNSHEPGWENGYKFGLEANEKLYAVSDFKKYAGADMPEEMSFFSIDTENVVVSVIKKAEDGTGVIIRGYEVEGKEVKSGLKSAFKIRSIIPTNLIEEENGEQLKDYGKMKFGAFAIETFKLDLKM